MRRSPNLDYREFFLHCRCTSGPGERGEAEVQTEAGRWKWRLPRPHHPTSSQEATWVTAEKRSRTAPPVSLFLYLFLLSCFQWQRSFPTCWSWSRRRSTPCPTPPCPTGTSRLWPRCAIWLTASWWSSLVGRNISQVKLITQKLSLCPLDRTEIIKSQFCIFCLTIISDLDVPFTWKFPAYLHTFA